MMGLMIGLVFTYMLFGNRGCSWLPENRVKNMIAEKEIIVGDSVKELMNCSGVSHNDVYRLLNDEGDVDFSKSKADIYPKEYWFTGTKDESELDIQYALFDSIVEVIGFHWKGSTDCSTSISNKNKTIVPLPEVEIIAIIESKEIRIIDKVECQMKCYGLTESEILDFHKSALNDINQSQPRLKPNPYYVMVGNLNGVQYQITYVIGENRTRISDIDGGKECNCED